jgi:uncharacterized protein YndB with AHSA1/START domain
VVPDQIEREVLIDAPVDVVWRVVTEPEHLDQWFTSTAELDLRPGGDGRFGWEGKGTSVLRVVDVDPPRRLAFRWCHPEGTEPRPSNSTLVELTLATVATGTLLRVVESGITGVDWPEDDKAVFVSSHTEGWARHLDDLATHASGLARTTSP